jgi:Domain of unknown function (DUF4337)
MEPADAAESIREHAAPERAEYETVERFRTRAAIIIGVLAGLLAIASVGGEDATKEMLSANIRAADAWAFYQAKNIRQTSLRLSADELEAIQLGQGPALSEPARQDIERKVARYQATADRYESEPDPSDPTNPLKGEGKAQLLAQAQNFEHIRDHAERKDRNFDFARGLYQIALVLGSVSIVATSRRLLVITVVIGAVATLLAVNGFFLLFDLPGTQAVINAEAGH